MTTHILSKPAHPGQQAPPDSGPSQLIDNRIVTRLFWAIAGAVGLIAVGSFVWSFLSLWELASAHSSQPALGWIWPLVTDLSMVIYTGAILVAHLQRRPARLPIALTIFYALVTIAGNVLHAPATPLGWFVAILPPLSLIFGTEMLRSMGHHIIERAGAVATLADLAADMDRGRADLAELQVGIESHTIRISELKAELARLRSEKKAEQYQTVGDETRSRAMQILAERSDISGAELGRLLGRSDTLARRLKRELLPLVTTHQNLPDAVARRGQPEPDNTGVVDRLAAAAIEDGKPGIADILTTAKRGWYRVNSGNGYGEVTHGS